MSDTLGGGLQVRTALDSCTRRLRVADDVELEQTIRFAQSVIASPLADNEEKLRAGDLLRKIYESGQSIALKLLDNERIDGGKYTGREEVVFTIDPFDDAG